MVNINCASLFSVYWLVFKSRLAEWHGVVDKNGWSVHLYVVYVKNIIMSVLHTVYTNGESATHNYTVGVLPCS